MVPQNFYFWVNCPVKSMFIILYLAVVFHIYIFQCSLFLLL